MGILTLRNTLARGQRHPAESKIATFQQGACQWLLPLEEGAGTSTVEKIANTTINLPAGLVWYPDKSLADDGLPGASSLSITGLTTVLNPVQGASTVVLVALHTTAIGGSAPTVRINAGAFAFELAYAPGEGVWGLAAHALHFTAGTLTTKRYVRIATPATPMPAGKYWVAVKFNSSHDSGDGAGLTQMLELADSVGGYLSWAQPIASAHRQQSLTGLSASLSPSTVDHRLYGSGCWSLTGASRDNWRALIADQGNRWLAGDKVQSPGLIYAT